MDFYSIVLTVAIVVFILLLTLMGLLITRANSSKIFPPTMSTCPDYWEVDTSGNCRFPNTKNALNTGIYNADSKLTADDPPFAITLDNGSWSFNPSNDEWAGFGKSSVCSKQKWAILNNVEWDGVSNYNGC